MGKGKSDKGEDVPMCERWGEGGGGYSVKTEHSHGELKKSGIWKQDINAVVNLCIGPAPPALLLDRKDGRFRYGRH